MLLFIIKKNSAQKVLAVRNFLYNVKIAFTSFKRNLVVNFPIKDLPGYS